MKIDQTLIRNRTLLTASLAAALSFTPLHRAAGAPDPIAPSNLEESTPPRQQLAENPALESPSLRNAISAFKKHPTSENRSSIKVALARLDLHIAEQRDHMLRSTGPDRTHAAAKLEDLKQYRFVQMRRLPKNAEMALNQPGQDRTSEEPSIALKVKDTALDVKDKAVSGAKSAGTTGMRVTKKAAIKAEAGAEKVAEKVEEGGTKVKRTLEKGARKTGDAIHDASH